MKNIFNTVKHARVGSSRFNLSHDVKTSFKMGRLIPTCVLDVLPGDKVKMGVENLFRFAPLVSPIMHEVKITTHYFFVPNRILWPGFEGFITNQTPAVPPWFDGSGMPVGSLADYMGIPTNITDQNEQVNALPIAAYAKIYDEYYRDQNLQPVELFQELNAGVNNWVRNTGLLEPRLRAWMHDYFTSALPTAQDGDPVTLPLLNNDAVDVELKSGNMNPVRVVRSSDQSALGGVGLQSEIGNANLEATSGQNLQLDPRGSLEVNIMGEASNINTLRRAFRLQEWLERNIRGGKRYIEQMYSHFGQKSSDARLDRPEYIGGSKQKMIISEVLSSAETIDAGQVANPVGNYAGHGISVGGGNSWRYNVEEHGWIIGIVNVQPVTAYQDGLQRKWSRQSYLDYAWPSFANIGEQEILNKEIYAASSNMDGTFGYTPRYAEYKYEQSRISGQFRTTLDTFHLARKFTSEPALNGSFIQAGANASDFSRIFADTTGDQIYAQIMNNIYMVRKLPKYGIPSI
jgi:hypothetical protein